MNPYRPTHDHQPRPKDTVATIVDHVILTFGLVCFALPAIGMLIGIGAVVVEMYQKHGLLAMLMGGMGMVAVAVIAIGTIAVGCRSLDIVEERKQERSVKDVEH